MAVDHAMGSIVVAVRGTLSVIDALTDLCLDSVLVDETGREEDRVRLRGGQCSIITFQLGVGDDNFMTVF